MKTLSEITALLKERLPYLKKKYPIERISVFGSVARNDQTPMSDVDIMVEFRKPIGWEFCDLASEIEEILNLKVDLVSRDAIKSRYFNHIKRDLVYV